MNIANNAFAKRLSSGLAALALLSLLPTSGFAMSAADRDACKSPECEIVAAVHVAQGQRGALQITDEKGRRWNLARIETAAAATIDFPKNWENGDVIATAYERYLAALERDGGPALGASPDSRYHLCIRAAAIECVLVPAR